MSYHGVDGGQAVCGKGEGFDDALGPEAREGLVVSRVLCILTARGFVVAWDGGAEAVEGGGGVFPEPSGGNREMGGVGPGGLGESTGDELQDEVVDLRFSFETISHTSILEHLHNRSHMFFGKELAGEPPLQRETAERLLAVAVHLFQVRFWELMPEERVLACGEEEMFYLNATGMLGGFLSLTVYRGPRGLAFLNRVRGQEYRWAGEMLVEQNFLRLRFTSRGDLRRADLKMLHVLGLPKGKADMVPEFSSARPGFQDWHVNNYEGLVLAKALEVFAGFLEQSAGIDPVRFWPFPESCPWLRFGSDGLVRVEQVPLETVALPEDLDGWTPPSDWPKKGMKRRGTWELGYFHPMAPIGKGNERKWIPRLCLVVDAQDGRALHHSLGQATVPVLAGLWAALVGAVEKVGHLPSRLRVYDKASEAMFRSAGFDVERTAEMRTFEHLREGMCEMMGDLRLDYNSF